VRGGVRRFPGLGLAILAVLFLWGCSDGNEASLSVRLAYPQEGTTAGRARPAYAKAPDNRILIRVLAPHIATPIEAWFDRSQGRGEISGIPPGDRIAVEVDEFDNTAMGSGTNAPLLGRGVAHGIALSPGESRTVTVPMFDRGTVITVAGNIRVAGDNVDELLGEYSYLNQPLDLEMLDEDLLILDYGNKKIKKLDRYGYLKTIAGNGTTVEIDGVDAISSGLANPNSISVGSNREVYIACTTSNKIRKLSDGIISRFAGTGRASSSPQGTLAIEADINAPTSISYSPNDGLFFIELTVGQIRLIDLDGYLQDRPDQSEYYGGQSGPITSVSKISSHGGIFLFVSKKSLNEFNSYYGGLRHMYYGGPEFWPEGACVYKGEDIYIADSGGYRIYHNYVDSDLYSEFIGLSTGLVSPQDVAVDSRGNVYIADSGNHAIRMVVGGALP